MAASAEAADITINVKGPSELKLSITISPSKTVADLKAEIQDKSEVEKERQRLIYSGKVLKDDDEISAYKIQTGHTIHMVKGAAKPAAGAAGGSAPSAQPLPQMGTGLNMGSNPLDNLERHHGLAGFNPFANMEGVNNLNDPNAMAGLFDSPEFMQQMSEMMSRPEIVEQMIASNPQLAPMGPQIRSMMANPMVRQMMSNPETLRMVMRMQAAMGGPGGAGGGAGGMGGMGGLGGLGGFGGLGGMGGMFGQPPAGGAGNAAGTGAAAAPTEPFPNLFAPQTPTPAPAGGTTGATGAATGNTPSGNTPANPLAGLLWPGMGGAGAGAGAGANPFGGFDPSMLFGGAGGGGFGGFGGAQAPRDTRPPEEIYATQLGQLNGMGLWDAQKNITALRRTGGNVEAAIELIFSGQLDN